MSTPADAPPLTGRVEWAGQAKWPEELLVLLDGPAPGFVHLGAHPMGGQVFLSLRFFLFGDQAPAAVARAEASWRAWLTRHFPTASA
ncbi:hypothetical protein [Archangium lansingense]|uniref:Uncharacterized protein n=1 Tax=Archangium lansingense TaxID=2995310 RepID=A0ABT4A4M6_9BACT|nr:hypothetical protein [Archangium lansinium]MCY1076583.1 hypothetical protein [Archangium lansinium]